MNITYNVDVSIGMGTVYSNKGVYMNAKEL